jgi:solute carrier family 25 (mitochondrial citrate transporter), member 1
VSTMLAGIAAGVVESVTVVTPGENLKTKIVEDRAGRRQFRSTRDVIRAIVTSNGISGLFRGIVPVTLKQGSNALVRFTTFQVLDDLLRSRLGPGRIAELIPAIAGAGAGIVTVYATMPFDVMKTKMQALSGMSTHRGTVQCFRLVVHQSGVRGLWKGTTPRLVRLSVSHVKNQVDGGNEASH